MAVTPTGQLTVRSPGREFAPEGTVVADRTGAFRGRVVRVFGPVAQPYLTVRLRRTPKPLEGAALVGTMLRRERGNNVES